MSDASGSGGDAIALTLVTMTTGERYEVDGSAESIEAAIVGASRGSIMQLAWLTEAGTGRSIAINPLHVVALETAPEPGRDRLDQAQAGAGPRARPGGEGERQVDRPGQVGLMRSAQVRALGGAAGAQAARLPALAPQPVRRRPGGEAQRARRPRRREQHAGRGHGGDAVGTEDEHGGRRSDARGRGAAG